MGRSGRWAVGTHSPLLRKEGFVCIIEPILLILSRYVYLHVVDHNVSVFSRINCPVSLLLISAQIWSCSGRIILAQLSYAG